MTARRKEEKKRSISGRSAQSPLKKLEQHNNLFQYGALQMKSIWESGHLNIQNQDERRYTDDAQR